MKIIMISILTVLTFTSVYTQDFKYTLKQNNYVREGRGSYYALVDILPKGVRVQVLETDKQWSRVKTPGSKVGWLSNNSITTKIVSTSINSKLVAKWSSSKVSKITLAGAIKGLTGTSNITAIGDPDKLIELIHSDLSDFQVRKFIELLDKYESENRGEVDFEDLNLTINDYDPDFNEQQMGFGIASRIAAQPVIDDKNIRRYLNLIGRALLEKSQFYDWEFHIILLNNTVPDGFACPGGYVFITTGAVKLCNDEAELAAIIAHELGHVLLKHGVKELSHRKVQMSMDDAFAELDGETSTKNKAMEMSLNDMAASSYERVVNYRTLEYEKQADKVCALLLANAGYDPFAIERFTGKLAVVQKQEKDIFNDNYLKPNDVIKRNKLIKNLLEEEFEDENPGVILKNRFENYYSQLFR